MKDQQISKIVFTVGLIIFVTLLVLLFVVRGIANKENNTPNEFRTLYDMQAVTLSDSDIPYDCEDADGYKVKYYSSLAELEDTIGYETLPSSTFNKSLTPVLYVKGPTFSEIYCSPKGIPKKALNNISEQNIYGFTYYMEPVLKISLKTDPKQESVPEEYMGLYEMLGTYETREDLQYFLVEEQAVDSGHERYIIIFQNNNAVYTFDSASTLEEAKEFAESFSNISTE